MRVNYQCIALGLYRCPDASNGAKEPYVLVAPPADTIVKRGDEVFVMLPVNVNHCAESSQAISCMRE